MYILVKDKHMKQTWPSSKMLHIHRAAKFITKKLGSRSNLSP